MAAHFVHTGGSLLAQLATPATGSGGSLPQTSFPVMIFVVLIIMGLPMAWLFWRRRGPIYGGNSRLLRIQESCMVGTRQFMVVAAYGNERVLVGVSPGKIEFLCKLNAGEKAAPPPGEPRDDASIFSRLIDKAPLK